MQNIFVNNIWSKLPLLLLSILLLNSCGGSNQGMGALDGMNKKFEDVKQPILSDSQEDRDDPIASQIAMKYAGFSKKTPDGYWYADTKKATEPTESFGVFSKSSNQMILFLVFDDTTATTMLPNFAAKPPYTAVATGIKHRKVATGEEPLGSGTKFKWILSEYPLKPIGETAFFRELVGGMPSVEEGKSILVVARSLDATMGYSHNNTLFIIDNLSKDRVAKEEVEEVVKKEEPKKDLSTDEDIDKFIKSCESEINEHLSVSNKIEKSAEKYKKKKDKEKEWKGTYLLVGIDAEGKLRSLGDKTTVPSEPNKEVVKCLIEAVQSVGKFKDAPVVEGSEFKFVVRLKGTKAVVEKESSEPM